ncbi:hypothetical protein ACIG0C_36360 [Kitasatospora aureofaciens]|uniref:hypothetical protein n=1 Tax=Kitasatospora aureofaciens TaxID=1894 RepID=UPI0037C5322B
MAQPADHNPDTCMGVCCGTCARCGRQFDPDDTRHDGHARHALTDYCRACVDQCHESDNADHRCVICA